ncbi:MAG TPA: hypothetical protein VNB22_20065 [Pyrinomonadaceae bacterium]|nr:hypothetical protein [Pyrinomonadaceae bacterium]
MNFRLNIFLLLAVFSSALFSACTSVESKTSEEVVIDSSSSKPSSDEVVITDSDLKGKTDSQISTDQESKALAKRILPDNSEVETLIDGFGNKVETRYFPEHPRLRLIILRTSADGKQEATVYGYGTDTKIVEDLGDKAMTASGDEIANTAGLNTTRGYSNPPNFMKKGKADSSLKPLPSSAFQKPVMPVNQPTEATTTSEKSSTQPNEEDED